MESSIAAGEVCSPNHNNVCEITTLTAIWDSKDWHNPWKVQFKCVKNSIEPKETQLTSVIMLLLKERDSNEEKRGTPSVLSKGTMKQIYTDC